MITEHDIRRVAHLYPSHAAMAGVSLTEWATDYLDRMPAQPAPTLPAPVRELAMPYSDRQAQALDRQAQRGTQEQAAYAQLQARLSPALERLRVAQQAVLDIQAEMRQYEFYSG